jgi:hypothetical protein
MSSVLSCRRQLISYFQQKRGREENEDEITASDDDGQKTKKPKKSKASSNLTSPHPMNMIISSFSQPPKASNIHTANIPHNNNIKALRAQWMCHKKPGCHSEHCFINPADSSHLPLSHPHFDVWGAAMVFFFFLRFQFSYSNQLKGPDTATLQKPPSHHLFNALNNNQVGQANALLERRARLNAQSAPAPPVAPTMNFNLNIPAEVATFLRPQAPPGPPAVDVPAATARDPGLVLQPLPVVSNTLQSMLISSDRLPGPELSLADFCSKYGLTNGISQKLDENGYAGSHTFEYASWDEMRDAGLKSGEIAQLKHAIAKWSTARNFY